MKTLTKAEAAKIRSNPPLNMSLLEAAAYVGVCTVTLSEEKKKGRVRCSRIGRRLIFQKTELDRYLSEVAA